MDAALSPLPTTQEQTNPFQLYQISVFDSASSSESATPTETLALLYN